jgi:hypothetical protein
MMFLLVIAFFLTCAADGPGSSSMGSSFPWTGARKKQQRNNVWLFPTYTFNGDDVRVARSEEGHLASGLESDQGRAQW